MNNLKTLLLLLLLVFPLSASNKIKVLVLHSYAQEYEWTKSQHNAFISTLNASNKTFEFYIEYLDSKRFSLTPEYVNEFVNHLKVKYANVSPDVIYVTDDNALNFIYQNYSKLYQKEDLIPVFFSGVNDFSMDTILAKEIFRGVFEKKEIKPNIELIKQFSPQTRDIYIIGDNSNTYKSIKKEVQREEHNFSNMQFHYINDIFISNVLLQLPQNKKIFAILTTIGNFKNENNLTLLPKESIDELKQNPNLILLTMEDAYMHKGVVGGYVTSGEKHGTEAAKLLLEYLEKQSLRELTSIKNGSNIYMFNSQELNKARVLLSEYIRRISTIINHNENFLQKNKLMILEILVIIFLVMTSIITVVYALQRKNLLKQNVKLSLIDENNAKLHSKELLLHKVLEEENMAYWKVNTQTNELYLSKELLNKLQINLSIYKDDKELLSYFIHFDDKKLFQENFQKVAIPKKPLHFNHKMLSANNKSINVNHFLYLESLKQNISTSIVGIIKFEN